MCNHEDRPCCGCPAEERATDYYTPEPFGYDEYDRYGDYDVDPEDCSHLNGVNGITDYAEGVEEGECDDCEARVHFSGVGDSYRVWLA